MPWHFGEIMSFVGEREDYLFILGESEAIVFYIRESGSFKVYT